MLTPTFSTRLSNSALSWDFVEWSTYNEKQYIEFDEIINVPWWL